MINKLNSRTGRVAGAAMVVLLAAGLAAFALARGRGGTGDRAEVTAIMPEMTEPDMAGMRMSSDGSVRLTAGQIQQFGITFGSVEYRTLASEVRTVGLVAIDETRIAQVAAKFGGFIEHLYVDFTGQPVRRGQPLAEVYSPELVAAQEELLLAARLDRSLNQSAAPGVDASSSRLLDAAIRRLQLWDVGEDQISEILWTGQVRRTLTLYAPVSGVVIERHVLRGQAVQPGQALHTIADLSEVWVEGELRETDAGSVREGSTVVVELSALPGRPIEGRVEYVYPTLQSEARTLKARIAVPNPDGRIKPGMYATVRLATPSGQALTVPSAAVVNTGERSIVYVDLGSGRLMPLEVETGRVAGDYTEILAGVEPGQRVVTSAQYLLDSESNMAEVMRSMIGMTGSGDMGGMDMGGGSMEGMDMPGADTRGMTTPQRRER